MILVTTLESKPKGRTHWSTRKMAEHAGVSASTVGRIWRTFGLQPHVVESFKISDDPLFIEKVRDIVGLYLHPPDHAVVLSFDEKPQIQALERAQPILPMDLGRPERQTHNYIRHGTVDLFAALNVATGQVVAQTKKQHRSRDFVSFLREIDERVDSALTVHVILGAPWSNVGGPPPWEHRLVRPNTLSSADQSSPHALRQAIDGPHNFAKTAEFFSAHRSSPRWPQMTKRLFEEIKDQGD